MHAAGNNDQSYSLFTEQGERKYLSEAERARFYEALDTLDEVSRNFCELLYWTGCRPSEALALTADSFNLETGYVVIRSLKKRRAQKGRHFRIVPLPRHFVDRLTQVHGLCEETMEERGNKRLWAISRTTGWVRLSSVMQAAGISGVRACARGLRHSFGVHAALCHVPETRIQSWLGHAHLSTTAIYLDMAALEDRQMAQRMWGGTKQPANDTTFGHELLRLLCAYSAIPETRPREDFLNRIEASAGGRFAGV